MSPETTKNLAESDAAGLNFKETELTLGLPGESRNQKSGTKRGFSETVDLNLGSSCVIDGRDEDFTSDQSENEISVHSKPPAAKAQVVGWPPVKSFRKNTMTSGKYVKVACRWSSIFKKS
ncbi:hypothetical protein F0562_024642 [Nyssa sinensis]|uniref:Auxin-responsive protein n=1 Tax=Nyssa sinensis TaxID=561372 RepID=A0A5J5BCL4_9ASTE|nr:hypothetical protein F0562_024642 [Nyssa sinensis]